MLQENDIVFILRFEPDILLEIYYVKKIGYSSMLPNEIIICFEPIIGERGKHLWMEKTLNLNKLIKRKYPGYFISKNEELIIKRLNILLKYKPKHKSV